MTDGLPHQSAASVQRQTEPLPAIRPKDVWEQVLDELRLQIVLGELRPGDRLIETDLAHQFDVSRGPIRTALLRLEQSGLVVSSKRRGVEVVRLGVNDIRQIFAVRIALEALAIRETARRSNLQIVNQMQLFSNQLAAARSEERWVEAAEADLAFHQQICVHSGNQVLYSVWLNLLDRLALIATRVYQSEPPHEPPEESSIRGHLKILEAIAAKNPDEAEAALREHLGGIEPRLELLSSATHTPLE